ncbi:MAG: twin-arginine translocation signal domain-containing protein, partial [Candidatus Nanohaloarchaea archaeon]
SEEKIEEIVDQKVEEKLHEKLSGGDTGDDYISQKIEEKLQELSETKGDSDGPIDRRSFLKALGLGAGGLALASPAASFLSLQNNGAGGGSQTLSDVLSEGNDMSGSEIVDTSGPITFGGGPVEVPDGNLNLLGDGLKLTFGASSDVSARFDATNDDLRFRDEGNGADRVAVDRTTGDLNIEGTFTEGSIL